MIKSHSINSERKRRAWKAANKADQIFRRCRLCNSVIYETRGNRYGKPPEYCTNCGSLPLSFKKQPRLCHDCRDADPSSGWASPFGEVISRVDTTTGRTLETEVIVLLCNRCYEDWCTYYRTLDSAMSRLAS